MIKLRDYEKDWLWDTLEKLNGQGNTLGIYYYEGDIEEDFGEMATNLIVEIIREKLEGEDNG